jgi:hypothetical protein
MVMRNTGQCVEPSAPWFFILEPTKAPAAPEFPMFAKVYRNLTRTTRRALRTTHLSVELLEGRALPSTLGVTGGVIPFGGVPGGVVTGSKMTAPVAHVSQGSGSTDTTDAGAPGGVLGDVKVTTNGGTPGGVTGHGNSDASVVPPGHGHAGNGQGDLLAFYCISRSSGEEIPQ